MKILFITSSYFDKLLYKNAVVNIVKSLTKKGHSVILLTGYEKDKVFSGMPVDIKHIHVGKFKVLRFFILELYIFLYGIFYLRSWHTDVVLCDYAAVFVLLPLFSIKGKTKFCLDLRTLPTTVNTWTGSLRQYMFGVGIIIAKNFFEGITVISPYMKQYISEKYSIKQEKIGVWSSGVCDEFFDTDKVSVQEINNIKKRLGFDKKFVVMYHGSLAKLRGLGNVISAVERIKNDYPDLRVLLLGESVDKETLESSVKTKNLEHYIKVLGPVAYERVADYIACCDVGILPLPNLIFWRVSSPLKLMEYLAMRKPVIVTDIEAHKDIIGDTNCGFYIKSDDPRDIAGGIIKAYNNRARFTAMGIAGRDLVRTRYTWNIQAAALERYLRGLVRD